MPAKVLFGAGKLKELHSEKLPGKKEISGNRFKLSLN